MIKTFNSLFVTMFGLGKIKFMPGTFGSLATSIFLFYLFHSLNISSNVILFGLIIIFIACPFYLFNPIDLYFQGDFSRTLNLLGESFYMYENISFPLFNVYNFSSPPGTNIVFTDSLPIFGLLCKIISKIQDEFLLILFRQSFK